MNKIYEMYRYKYFQGKEGKLLICRHNKISNISLIYKSMSTFSFTLNEYNDF